MSQRPMPADARRSGLDVLRAVLRRRHPGYDVIIEVETDDRVHDTATREIRGTLPAPQHPDSTVHRIDVAATTLGGPHHDAVDEAAEDLPPLVDREAA